MADVTIARILKTRGVRGEVVAEVLTDFPARFESLEQVTLRRGDDTFVEELERHWFHKGRLILKFSGRDRPHEVEALVGCQLQVGESERPELPSGTFFDDDLKGCEVIEAGRRLGIVDSIYRVGSEVRNLVVRREGGDEFMIPLASAFVEQVDLKEKRILVKLPAGLIDITGFSGGSQGGGRHED